ncbi:MAG TPA: hypothetical protein DCE56_13840 [Cyanobacteria bacterium UBA8553]|nr:hypothetical protein [Cyanobacteria bacterium UBA8553]HAJ62706.1 hypothetical protein [Cyanobacteria bacterium UBA8543]
MTSDAYHLNQINQEFLEVLSRLKQHTSLLDDLADLRQELQQLALSNQSLVVSETVQPQEEQSLIHANLVELTAQVEQLKQEQLQVQTAITSLHSQLQVLERERLIFLNQLDRLYGQTLEQYTQKLQSLPMEQTIDWSVRIMLQTCSILNSLHTADPVVIHGNVQPSCILFRESDKRAFLIGNIGKELKSYKAPEQEYGAPTPQSDVYAVGTTLISLLTGKDPREFQVQHDANYSFNLEEIPLPSSLKDVIHRATQYKLTERYQTVKDLMQALREIIFPKKS